MDEYGMDLDEVMEVIDTADVLVIRFAILDKRLLIDARHDEVDGPLVKLVLKTSSVEERFRSLKELRPRFPLPEKIVSFSWPRQVETFRLAGLWSHIVDRLIASGHAGVKEQCEAVFGELVDEEKAEVITAIRGGPSYQSLWQRREQ
ncbi:MAG: hypothetical protein MUP14_06175 [Dehalococcoidia bacterium]|nr:hypothetical protein [Dehalococcoidia bacterium]